MARPLFYELFGQRLTRTELAELAGIDPGSMHRRLQRMTVIDAVITPLAASAGVEMIGRRFGRLVVLSEEEEKTAAGKRRYLCRCDCGKTTVVVGADIRSGRTTSCNCQRIESTRATRFRLAEDMTGRVFADGWIKVLGPGQLRKKTGPKARGSIRSWRCRCRCGKIFETKAAALRSGQTTSCSCRKNALAGARARARAHRFSLFGQALTLNELVALCGREMQTLRYRMQRMSVEEACFGRMRRTDQKGRRKKTGPQMHRCRACGKQGHNARSCPAAQTSMPIAA